MPRDVCCVPGCPVVAGDGVPLHYFPCPKKDRERFKNWVKIIGGDIVGLDSTTIHKTKRICRQHFRKDLLYPKNRLCRLAVPSLLLPSVDVSAPTTGPFICEQSSSSIKSSSTSQGALMHGHVIQPMATVTVKYFNHSSSVLKQKHEKFKVKKLERTLRKALKVIEVVLNDLKPNRPSAKTIC